MISRSLLSGTVILLALTFFAFTVTVYADDYPSGDANGSYFVDIDDIVYMIDYIFTGGPDPVTLDAGDANCTGLHDIDDVVYLVAYVFTGGPTPCTYGDPTGSLTGFTGCKTFEISSGASYAPPDQDCIEFIYDGVSVLDIVHVNEGLNCCPVILADIWIEESVITIDEIDSLDNGGCWCLCLFDVEYRINGLEPGIYNLVVNEPYVPDSLEKMEFMVDLTTANSGSFCITRNNYPWGMW